MRMKQTPEAMRVRCHSLSTQLQFGLNIADSVYKEYTGREVTITSISDGTHGWGSYHPTGNAGDLRLPSFYSGDTQDDRDLLPHLKKELGPDFDVKLEADKAHYHIEWHPKEPL